MVAEILPLIDACRFLERRAAAILKPRLTSRRDQPVWIVTQRSEIQRVPWGLVLILAPSNYLLFIPAAQALQALVAGNAVLLKPGANGLAAANLFSQLLAAAGLPKGLLTVLPEAPEAGARAIDTGVDKVVLTGSANTGRAVLGLLAPRLIPGTMELSGSDAVLVRADADLDLVVRGLIFGLKLNRGATCIAPRRVLVHASRLDELEQRLSDGLRDVPEWPLAENGGVEISKMVREALANGARILAGRLDPGGAIKGPLVVTRARPPLALLREAVFAPVLALVTVTDDDEAVNAASLCPYALGAAVFSADEPAAVRLAERLPVGFVSVNDLIAPSADARLPFGGGRGDSGYGVTRGAEGLLEMTRVRVLTVSRGHWRPHFDPPRPGDEQGFRNFILAAHGCGFGRRVLAWLRLFAALIHANLVEHRRRER
jgi:acyl-CoA reductase-like NAD-dependent aldehyde dehydrogenase